MSFRSFITLCISTVINGLVKTSLGQLIYEQFLQARMDIKIPVRHGEVNMIFTSPNALTRYRADSFSIKEPETLIWLESIPKGAIFWDVGANVGLYSVYAAKKNNIQVFAFEPSVFNIELLARNIFLNDLVGCVTIVPLALSDMLGPNLFKMSTTSWGGALSTFGQDFDQHGKKLKSIFEYHIMGITMDEAMQLLGIPSPLFIKIDVDGIEHLILRGGTNILKGVESVMIEIDDGFNEQAEEAAEHLRSAGLTLLQKFSGGKGSQYNQWWVRRSI